ncbi:clavesin-2, partial [Nephila pilipes]
MSDITRQNTSFKYALSEATKLDEDSLRRAKDKIGETEANRSQCLHVLRTNLNELEDIEPCLDENFLLKFLRVAKFDCKKAFDRIKNYYRLQDILLNRLKNGSMPITKVREIPYSFLLPYRNENNAVIVVAKMGLLDYSKLSFEKMSYLDWLLTDYLLANPITQIYGVITILDFADFKFRSALAVNPKTAFEYMFTVQ